MWSGAYNGDCKDRVWRPEVMGYRQPATQLTKLTKNEVWTAERMAQDLSKDTDERRNIIWRMLGEHLA
mgnify:CR=1 FL=1